MSITRTKTFRSGNSEAVRLPREIAFFEGVELTVVRSGDVVTLYPTTRSVADMAARLAAMPAPGAIEQRDDEEIPDRPGL